MIVLSQFFCTSLWFVGNSIVEDIRRSLQLNEGFLAHLTSAVQFGFITGTLVFAVLAIADRFRPTLVFFACSLFAAVANLALLIPGSGATSVLLFRFLTGFFLAGIYPVGMKIAADHYKEGLGRSLGYLVGALVVGTALPHLLKDLTGQFHWHYVIYATSLLSGMGGLAMLLWVPDGPFRKPGQPLRLTSFLHGFHSPAFRQAAFGYFGHMWELYTFWAFVPLMLAGYNELYPSADLNIPFWSFLVIASGGPACVISGSLSGQWGAKRLATLALLASCLCCLVSPIVLVSGSPTAFLLFLFIWGIFVIADSPLFSTLVARHAPPESRGSSLTIVNCIGFAITIVSIQFVNLLRNELTLRYLFMLLAIGPVLGLLAVFRKDRRS